MNIWVLFIDPDNGNLNDVKSYAFSTRVRAESTKTALIENGCESLLSVRELRVTDMWDIDFGSNDLFLGDDENEM
jgi:hypothetical protein